MRTSLASPEPPPRGTIYTSSATLNTTLVDVRPADLFPVNRATTATTRGWINLNWNR